MISGGRILKAGTRIVANRIAPILRLAANALSRAQGRMGESMRHGKGRLGKAEGIVAGAHKLARVIWAQGRANPAQEHEDRRSATMPLVAAHRRKAVGADPV